MYELINKNKTYEAYEKNYELTIGVKPEDSKKIRGDIDELIFPDDEPYYVSER